MRSASASRSPDLAASSISGAVQMEEMGAKDDGCDVRGKENLA